MAACEALHTIMEALADVLGRAPTAQTPLLPPPPPAACEALHTIMEALADVLGRAPTAQTPLLPPPPCSL